MRTRGSRALLVIRTFAGIVVLGGFLGSASEVPAASNAGHGSPVVHTPDFADVSQPLREIVPFREAAVALDKRENERPKAFRAMPAGEAADPLRQAAPGALVAVSPGLNFDGVGVGFGAFDPNVAPPDTNMSVGTTQVVQWVNLSFAVFDKTGQLLLGPVAGNSIWSGFAGGRCDLNNDGDPIVQYDKMANRWILTQFSVSGGPPFFQCVAVSRTSDATGAYARYAFSFGNQFNDYPKLGVWPDGYYMTYNLFLNGQTFSGGDVCAMDRTKMLAGDPSAGQVCFILPNDGGLLPADLDGSRLPAAGTPNFVLSFGTNALNFYRFHADFANPGSSSLTGPTVLPVAAFTPACGGGACIPQAGTKQVLDSLGDRLMYRLAYRSFADHESLVVNHSVKVGAGRRDNQTGVRWYELRNPMGNPPTVFQQGTYAPDALFRWMGSMAMDKVGNIAVGYSVSSSSMNPAIRFTGRAPADVPGTLGSESSLIEGTGSQGRRLDRWGDYSSISLDPVDDCTFWYTTEYLKANGTFNWSTRIGSFKLAGCQ
jgi:hypothetical protein